MTVEIIMGNGWSCTIEELRKAFDEVARMLGEIIEAVIHGIENINKIISEWDKLPDKIKWQRVKEIRPNSYIANYKQRVCCIGNKGNYRRWQ